MNADQLKALDEDQLGDPSSIDYSKRVHSITLVEPETIDNHKALSDYTKEELEISRNIQEYLEKEGSAVSSNIIDFYKKKLCDTIYNIHLPTTLPMSLSMTLDGISSLSYGQTFQINYLPKTYKNKVFFQITKVSHTLKSGNWETKLDTQFRFNPEVKQVTSKINTYLSHWLNVAFLRQQVTDELSQLYLPFHAMLKILPESSVYWLDLLSVRNQIVNYDGLFSFECRFDTESDSDVEGFDCKDNKPIVPDSIYDVIPPINVQWEDSVLNVEYSMFLYGAVFGKDAFFDGKYLKDEEKAFSVLYKDRAETYVSDASNTSAHGFNMMNRQSEFTRWNDMEIGTYQMTYAELKEALLQFPNFKAEKVDQTGGKRFLIADASHRQGNHTDGEVMVFGGGSFVQTDTRTQRRSAYMPGMTIVDVDTKQKPLYDSEVIAFYPGIPHAQKQFAVVYLGKIIWVPYEQFMALDDVEKRKALLAIHLFIFQTKKQPMMIYDRSDKGNAFISLVNGYTKADEVKAKVYNMTQDAIDLGF